MISVASAIAMVLINIVAFVILFKCILSRRNFCFVCAGFAILLYGFFVYLLAGRSGDECSVLHPLAAAVNQSLSAFWPSRGGYDKSYLDSWFYWLFHSLVLLYVGLAIIAILWKSLFNSLSVIIRLGIFNKETNVFWDFCDEARWMASTIKDGSSVVFALREESRTFVGQVSDAVSKLLNDGFKWVYAAPGRASWLSSANRHFFLGPNGHENVSGAKELVASYHGKDCIKVFVRISAAADDDVLYAWADKLNEEKGGTVEIIVVREESIVSTKFLREHSMLDCPGINREKVKGVVSGKFRMLVIGFGTQGERLLADSICDAQFVDVDSKPIPMEFVAIDRDESSFGWFKANCGEACGRYGIRFVKLEAGTEKFWKWLEDEPEFTRIVVCLNDDRENISLAHDISRLYKLRHWELWRNYRKPGQAIVYARVRGALISQYVSTTYDNKDVPFLPFGSMKDIYDAKFIMYSKWRQAAVWVNALYVNPKEENENVAEANWLKRCSLDKESSFASAFHQRNLLRLIRYEIVDADVCAGGEDNKADRDSASEAEKQHKDIFSRIEHLRWMAFHFVRGIECWCPSVDELRALARYDNGKRRQVKPNMLLKGSVRHVHAALRDFDDLPEVDAVFDAVNLENGQNAYPRLQDYDNALTCGFEALKKAGFEIRKENA